MDLKELEIIFNRALLRSCSRKKLFFIAPVLFVCGVMTVLCRVLAIGAGRWVLMSLTFLPIFLCGGLLLAAGVVLIRMYHNEIKLLPTSFRKLFSDSWEVMIGVSYLSLPLILAYLLLWTILGIFYLLAEIPSIGSAIGVILSFGPFLIVLGSIILSILSVNLLFFVTPQVALKSGVKRKLAEDVIRRLKANPFRNLLYLILALLPTLISVAFLSLAAMLTGMHLSTASAPLSIGLQWFFVMLPFCCLLAPSIVFFFNFSAEAYVVSRRTEKSTQDALEEQTAKL